MKNYRKTITILLMAAALLATVFMTGCTRRTEGPDTTTPDATAPDTAAGTAGPGVYVRMERSDAGSIFLRGSGFSKVGKNADGTLLKVGEWLYTGDDIVQVAREENSSVLFTVGALAADDTLLAEGSFLYDTAQEKLYVTISEDGVTCSTSDAADAAADVPSVLTLPILDEIDATVTVGVSGSSLSAVRAAAKLLDWAAATGLGAEEVGDAASTWLASRNDDLTECLQKLEMVDDACRGLLTGEARAMLDSAGCADTEITWGSQMPEPAEAIMQAAGLR